ncbi:MAG: hypothetical protein QOG01_1687 [Pseudonocardiales bacterium]|jgi:hypothetical protein|nr:hypothetical protein [Pseudonocardiales bacterium]
MTAVARRSIEAALAQARGKLARFAPREADEAVRRGAVLIDIRPALYRETEGGVPGAIVIERNALRNLGVHHATAVFGVSFMTTPASHKTPNGRRKAREEGEPCSSTFAARRHGHCARSGLTLAVR